MWYLVVAVVLRVLSNPLGNAVQKKLTAGYGTPLTVNFMTFMILGVLCIYPGTKVSWQEMSPAFWSCCIIAGVLGAAGNGFLVMALQRGDLSVLGPINSWKSVVGILFGICFLHEFPSVYGLLGLTLIITGSYFVLETVEGGFSLSLLKNREIQYRIAALVLTAAEAVFIKKIILLSSTMISFIVWCWFGAIFSFILRGLIPSKEKRVLKFSGGHPVFLYAVLVLCIGMMQYTTNYVFERMNVGYALALFQLSTIIAVFLGYSLFHERNILKKLIGTLLMMTGSVLIILLS